MAELYDMKNDPDETTNLVRDPKYKSKIDEMEERLVRAMKAVGLSPDTDTMPIDQGIGTALPDKAIR